MSDDWKLKKYYHTKEWDDGWYDVISEKIFDGQGNVKQEEVLTIYKNRVMSLKNMEHEKHLEKIKRENAKAARGGI